MAIDRGLNWQQCVELWQNLWVKPAETRRATEREKPWGAPPGFLAWDTGYMVVFVIELGMGVWAMQIK